MFHYHFDHLGSVQAITDINGAVFTYIRYKPYGEVRGRWGADSCGTDQYCREFTGYDTEPISGLEYAVARVYDPALGMFLTHDPIRNYPNPYAYVSWDPINSIDPTGMDNSDWIPDEVIVVTAPRWDPPGMEVYQPGNFTLSTPNFPSVGNFSLLPTSWSGGGANPTGLGTNTLMSGGEPTGGMQKGDTRGTQTQTRDLGPNLAAAVQPTEGGGQLGQKGVLAGRAFAIAAGGETMALGGEVLSASLAGTAAPPAAVAAGVIGLVLIAGGLGLVIVGAYGPETVTRWMRGD